MTQRLLSLLTLFLLLTGCGKEAEQAAGVKRVDIRYSCAVARFYRSAPVTQWLQRPGKMYIQTHFYIPGDLSGDIIFGINLAFSEGLQSPLYYEGANWHSMAGLTRDGQLWIAYGTELALSGIPSDASAWETIDLDASIKPETWYSLRLESDFNQRRFLSLTLEGPGLKRTIDLREFPADYPFDSPFDHRNLSFSIMALRNPGMIETGSGSTKVYFDQVEGAVEINGRYEILLRDGFENQNRLPDFHAPAPVIRAGRHYRQGSWYPENQDALVSLSTDHALNGKQSCVCDARLE